MSKLEDEPGETRVEEEPKKVRVPARVKAGGKRVPVTAADWLCIQEMYEVGGYSQRQLADWAKARGIAVSQSGISRRIQDHDWMKASVMERMRKQVLDAQMAQIGDGLRGMLEQHSQQGSLVVSECLQHFQRAAKLRKKDSDYVWPAASIATITQTLRSGQEMQARAMGWNYKEGRPFRPDDKTEETKPQQLTVGVLSTDEEDAIRASLEKSIADGD